MKAAFRKVRYEKKTSGKYKESIIFVWKGVQVIIIQVLINSRVMGDRMIGRFAICVKIWNKIPSEIQNTSPKFFKKKV